jgi:hypothetical protein
LPASVSEICTTDWFKSATAPADAEVAAPVADAVVEDQAPAAEQQTEKPATEHPPTEDKPTEKPAKRSTSAKIWSPDRCVDYQTAGSEDPSCQSFNAKTKACRLANGAKCRQVSQFLLKKAGKTDEQIKAYLGAPAESAPHELLESMLGGNS